ncbi:GNAT family N-acetyltransferase [Micavibrio aeruginosavorus]|uniref:GCN5-related N-acetyltransferase n=1 Tax=Micavibrio aeruginosavorus EPB TaxID=349215 RepID=M4VII2_9BACT|nr:GNAT family N-acetyltransferase [Micavibrio aeruginosavorus]AGH98988.1 GCN5-related N-acetyltransferase [Micavibrio aeruginosavorus EPB]
MTTLPIIAPLNKDDYDGWLPLWQANMEGTVTPDVTASTWARICDPTFPVHGLCARLEKGGPIVGICHFILHPTTGSLKYACYMQDLFVDPSARRRGVGRELVIQLAALGQAAGWARLYWLAEEKNAAAQSLYRDIGIKLDFSLHVLPLG